MIARGAGFDASRAGQIGGDHAAERSLAGLAAKQRAVVHRLEFELLIVLIEQRLDLAKRRASLGREHQLGRLVQPDTGKPGEAERDIRLAGAPAPALAPLPGASQTL